MLIELFRTVFMSPSKQEYDGAILELLEDGNQHPVPEVWNAVDQRFGILSFLGRFNAALDRLEDEGMVRRLLRAAESKGSRFRADRTVAITPIGRRRLEEARRNAGS